MTIGFENIPQGKADACQNQLGAPILDYYNADKPCDPPREGSQSLGISFSTGALAITGSDFGGPGEFGSGHDDSKNAAGTLDDERIIILLKDGLQLREFSLWFNGVANSFATVELFSGDQSAGVSKLEMCTSPGVGDFCGWLNYTKTFSEATLITTIVLAADPNSIVFDDLTLTTAAITPVPEPSSIALAAAGLVLVAGSARRRRI